MKCAKLHLQERSKSRLKSATTPDKPKRYCQKRMINPQHEEDPRWIDILDRFRCIVDMDNIDETNESEKMIQEQESEDIYLTVQNLQFQGIMQQRKRPRTSFKYKTLTGGKKHRMFVKEIVEDGDINEIDRSSEVTCYYFDDYAKYFQNSDRSRPSSGKSSIFLYSLSNKFKENKATQVDLRHNEKVLTKNIKIKKMSKDNQTDDEELKEIGADMEDARVAFYKSGKRKSLTISRTDSPATVQVIRVDVVCNYNSSSSDDDKKSESNITEKIDEKSNGFKRSHYINKYLLTNTVKTLDENVSGGAKVTLLCKTFKLANRSKRPHGKPRSNNEPPNNKKLNKKKI